MEPRIRLFLWAGTAVLTALSLQPASEVLAADLRGTDLATEPAPPRAELVTTSETPELEAVATGDTGGRRS